MQSNQQILDYFETVMKEFLVARLSHLEDWWETCISPEIREDASLRYEDAKKINDVLNKPDYDLVDYLNFDSYGKIILRRDNWKAHFEAVFLDKPILQYKMRVIQSLRNDIRHGRKIGHINSLRFRLDCYDILSQIYETERFADRRTTLAEKLGLEDD